MLTNEILAQALERISKMTPQARVMTIKNSQYGEELFMGYYFSEYIKYPFAPFHFEMFQDWRDLRDGKIRELAWIVYREAAKSSIAKVLLTKMVCFNERAYLNVDSFDKSNAENFLFDIAQNLLTNRRIISDFGQLYDRKRSTEELTRTRMDNFLTKNNVLVEAHSIAESVRGRIFGHERPSWLCHKKGTKMIHNGEWILVENHPSFCISREEKGKIVSLYSIPDTETVTNEHRYWCKHIPLVSVKKTTLRKQKDSYTGWVEAKDLTSHHYIGHKIDYTENKKFPKLLKYISGKITTRDKKTGRIISAEGKFLFRDVPEFIDPDWWWMIGLWWGDGHLAGRVGAKDCMIGITIANTDKVVQEKVFKFLNDRKIKYSTSERRGCFQLVFSNTVMARWLRTWRTGNSIKTPPMWVESIPIGFQKNLILGYIAADGYFDKRNKSIRITSVCLPGLHSARRILARIGISASIRNGIDGKENVDICGTTCKTQKKYDLRFREGASILGFNIENQKRYTYPETFIKDGFLWSKVKSISDSKKEIFCPINVDGHSYTTKFGLSHNCLDDFETNKTKDSLAYTTSTRGHIEEFASGLASNAGILYLGNYITKTGVVQWLMDRAKEDQRIRIRMVPAIENGEPTWPSKYAMTNEEAEKTNKVSLEDKRKQLGTVVFETEMMNNPIGSEYQVFKKEMFHRISLDEVLKKTCRVFLTLDTAISQTKNGDYTGGAINFVDMEGKWNIMAINRRMTPKQLIDFVFEIHNKYHPEQNGIEKTTFQMALKEFFEEEMRKRNQYPVMVDLLHGGKKKEERIRGSLLGRYESGSINHIDGYCEELEQQLLAFPNSVHDDVIDALSYQDQIAQSPFQQVLTKVTPHVPQSCA